MKRIIPFFALLISLLFGVGTVFAQNKTSPKRVVKTEEKSSFEKSPNGKLLTLMLQNVDKVHPDTPEMTSLLMQITELNGRLSDNDKNGMEGVLYQRLCEARKSEKYDELNTLAYIYTFVVDENHQHIPDVLFMQGELSSFEPFDTITLNRCIQGLEEYGSRTGRVQKERIGQLQEAFNYIRNLVPLSKDLDGIWVSSLADSYNRPYFIMHVNDGRFTMSPQSSYVDAMSHSASMMYIYAQSVEDIGTNSTYLSFCSESMRNPSPEIYQLVAGVKNTLMEATYTQMMNKAAKGGTVAQLGANFASGLINMGMEALINEMMTPSKKIYVTEMCVHKANPDELYVECNLRYVYMKGNNEPQIQDENCMFKFLRWTPQSRVYFSTIAETSTQTTVKPIYPGNFQKYSEKELRKLKNDKNWDFRNDYLLLERTRAFRAYNSLMLKKLIYQTEQEAKNQGYPLPPGDENFEMVATLGVTLMSESEKNEFLRKEKMQATNGVVIKNFDMNMPAMIFGLKIGDIITHLDGYEMNTSAEVIDFVQGLSPYDNLKISYLHRGKPTEKTVVLSYTLKPVTQ